MAGRVRPDIFRARHLILGMARHEMYLRTETLHMFNWAYGLSFGIFIKGEYQILHDGCWI